METSGIRTQSLLTPPTPLPNGKHAQHFTTGSGMGRLRLP